MVSSTLKLNALATGATVLNEVSYDAKDKADLVVATPKVLTTRSISDASRRKALSADPATFEALARSAPVADAKLLTASVLFSISFVVNPSLASSIWSPVISVAVN